jgi:PAS domain-containing protein
MTTPIEWSVEAQPFLKAILDCVAQPVWVVDHDGLIRFANPAALAALGYDDPAELVQKRQRLMLERLLVRVDTDIRVMTGTPSTIRATRGDSLSDIARLWRCSRTHARSASASTNSRRRASMLASL